MTSSETQRDDCIIIGAGPAGLTAAIYLARFHLSIRLFDCGSSRAAMIPCTRNHAGYPEGIKGTDLLRLMYAQAKRYGAGHSVGRPEIQGFVGALHGHQATQGIFITTSAFTRDAVTYTQSVSASVVLVDGPRLTDLMITYGVGVDAAQTFIVYKIDEDYFE